MATTRLIPLHAGKGKTINEALERTIEYVENPNKTNDGELISSYECDPLIAQEQFLFSKSQYTRYTGRTQGEKDIIAYHLRQSFKPGEIDAQTANKIGYELAMSLTKGKHAFIVCTHNDKDHIHSHIVFNSTNLSCDRKFRNFWNSHKIVRRISDKLCLENGLSIVENPKESKGSYATWLGEKPATFSDKLRLAIDEILANKPKTFDDFLCQMIAKGFELKDGKYIAFKGKGQKKFIRLKTLGEAYTEEKIKAVIGGEIVHISTKKIKFKKEEKVNLLIDLQTKINKQKGAGFEHWAKIYNVKQMAQTMIFLQENNLLDYGEFEEKASKIVAKFHEKQAEIKVIENRMNEIKTMQNHIFNYSKTREVYATYNQILKTKPTLLNPQNKIRIEANNYYNEHKSEIIIHQSAKTFFNQQGLEKLPTIKQLQAEYSSLYSQKNQTYQEYKKTRNDMQEILKAKQNVEQVLGLKNSTKTKKRQTQEH